MKKLPWLVAASGISLSLGAQARSTNLLTNGSFENDLSGWTTSGGGTYAPTANLYGEANKAAFFGETVNADNSASLSSDATGLKGLYFVEDTKAQTLSQTVSLVSAGSYSIGFSTYAPLNGWSNAHDSSFSATVDNNEIFSTQISGLTPHSWQAQAGTLSLGTGSHTVTFSFTPTGYQGKDIVIDRVYLAAVTPVPEPESYAMMLLGLGFLGLVSRRKNTSGTPALR